MSTIYLVFYLLTLLTIFFIGIYNLVYKKHCENAELELQIAIPRIVKKILVVNTITSFTAAFILVVIIMTK